MKNALILHGTNANSRVHWFPWLKRELEKRGWKVWVPDLPRADRPNIKRYTDFLFANMDWKFDAESVLIGHSSGAVAILGLLQHLPDDVVVDTCILVGVFKDDLGWESLTDLFEEPFDFAEIKKHARRFLFIHSDNDPFCPLSHARLLARKVDGKLLIRRGEGHFFEKDGRDYTELPYLLELLSSD